MKKEFIVAVIAAVAIVPETQAALTFLDGPYEFLDTIVMKFYKPLIWAAILGWAQTPAC